MLGSRLGQGSGRFPFHVAVLAGGKVGRVKGRRISLRELRVLPLVIAGKGANLLIAVQRNWKVRFVTDGAKLGSLMHVLHDSF